jgi:uncharacterized protein (DUF427 family)
MPKAIWKGALIAESDDTTLLEGDYYFPPETVHREYLRDSGKISASDWKGEIRHLDVIVGKHVNKDAAFYYPEPLKAASSIKGHIAFTKGVQIVK